MAPSLVDIRAGTPCLPLAHPCMSAEVWESRKNGGMPKAPRKKRKVHGSANVAEASEDANSSDPEPETTITAGQNIVYQGKKHLGVFWPVRVWERSKGALKKGEARPHMINGKRQVKG